jgi:NAD(P)-dependent dehydrogenase (short-subunit alcohol dehydrogenase family)
VTESRLPSLPRHALGVALAFALAACGASDAGDRDAPAAERRVAAAPARAPAAPDQAALVDEIAATLQACSYDGSPVRIGKVSQSLPSDCRDMVAQIMKFTGLPQNFTVVEAPVPNAAALIMLDEQKVPQRVIAFNTDFMDIVRSATGGNAWAPVSIMAHEIGHHLSGHTITPGGSQPPTELEADKFSGFVLYKMGASLLDAQTAMSRLVEEGPDGPTHPGRGKRLAAIEEGWTEACEQQSGGECDEDAQTVAAAPPMSPAPVVESRLPSVSGPSDEPIAVSDPVEPVDAPETPIAAAGAHGPDVIPAPGTTPSKFNRFVYDAFGYLDAEERAKTERRMFEVARDAGVEVVTLMVDDLHGMDANDYAWAMLRQLRVGKLDVGNGAVIVIAPKQGQAAIAMGPGLMLENGFLLENHLRSLQGSIADGWPVCEKYQGCAGWTQNFFGPSRSIANGGDGWEWSIRDQDLPAMLARHEAEFAQRQTSGTDYDPMKSTTWRKIVRFSGTVADLTPAKDDPNVYVGKGREESVGPALLVRYDGDRVATVYAHPQIAGLMPAGALEEGRRYSFVARVHNLHLSTPQLDLLSYDALD